MNEIVSRVAESPWTVVGDPWSALVDHGAGACVATVLAGRLVHRRAASA